MKGRPVIGGEGDYTATSWTKGEDHLVGGNTYFGSILTGEGKYFKNDYIISIRSILSVGGTS